MADPLSLPSEWFWRALVGGGSALLATGTTIFATRKNNEASVLAAVNDRISAQFERQDAEIENLRHTVSAEREECERKLAAMRAQIADLMNAGPPANYSAADAAQAVRVGRAAQARVAGKPKGKT